jgi:hypothetical protein
MEFVMLQDRNGAKQRVEIPRAALANGRAGVDAWIASQAPALTPPKPQAALEAPATAEPAASIDDHDAPDAGEE